MNRLFTKRFCEASPTDQRLIVDSVLRDLAEAVPFDDTGRVRVKIRRIE